jgi:hypothetical protein
VSPVLSQSVPVTGYSYGGSHAKMDYEKKKNNETIGANWRFVVELD